MNKMTKDNWSQIVLEIAKFSSSFFSLDGWSVVATLYFDSNGCGNGVF